MGVRRVRDAAYWGVPAGTVIAPGMKPKRSAAGKMTKAVLDKPGAGNRPGSAAALFAAGAGKGRIHAAMSRPAPTSMAPQSTPALGRPTSGRALADARAARYTFDAAPVAQQLLKADSRDEARKALGRMKMAQLWRVAAELGVHAPASSNKTRLTAAIVENTTGRRLDSLALSRRT